MDYNIDFTLPPFSQNTGNGTTPVEQAHQPGSDLQANQSSANTGASMSPWEIQRAQETALLDKMMATRTGTFQSLIQSMDHLHQVKNTYLQMHNKRTWVYTDFPSDAEKQRELVRALFDAAHDCSNVLESEGSISVKVIQGGKYTDLEFEMVLWALLISTRDAQEGRCNIPNYQSSNVRLYNEYYTFMERFSSVCDALKSSKDLVVSIFKDETMKHRVAWRPKSELSRKAWSRKSNDQLRVRILGTAKKRAMPPEEPGSEKDPKGKRPAYDLKQEASSSNVASSTSAQQHHAFQAEVASQETSAPLPDLSTNDMDLDAPFDQSTSGLEGIYSGQFIDPDDPGLWALLFDDNEPIDPPLDGQS